MPIIKRNNCVYVTLGTCYSVRITVWYAGWSFIPTCIPDSHPHRITSTKCHINIVVSPDDGHKVTWNVSRLINILRINCAPSWLYLQDSFLTSTPNGVWVLSFRPMPPTVSLHTLEKRKISFPCWNSNNSLADQPTVSHYTEYTTPTPRSREQGM